MPPYSHCVARDNAPPDTAGGMTALQGFDGQFHLATKRIEITVKTGPYMTCRNKRALIAQQSRSARVCPRMSTRGHVSRHARKSLRNSVPSFVGGWIERQPGRRLPPRRFCGLHADVVFRFDVLLKEDNIIEPKMRVWRNVRRSPLHF